MYPSATEKAREREVELGGHASTAQIAIRKTRIIGRCSLIRAMPIGSAQQDLIAIRFEATPSLRVRCRMKRTC
jgi:hypothetical protein